jgi:hypothetical protein
MVAIELVHSCCLFLPVLLAGDINEREKQKVHLAVFLEGRSQCVTPGLKENIPKKSQASKLRCRSATNVMTSRRSRVGIVIISAQSPEKEKDASS